MNDLLQQLHDWGLYMGALGLFGFGPGFVLRLALLLYPSDDERRAELLAELYALPRWKRPMWVAEQLETALFEGPKERRRNRSRRRRNAVEIDERPAGLVTTWELEPRERLIAELFAQGVRRNQIAAELAISPRTVDSYLQRIYGKLGVRDREALVHALELRDWRRG